MYQVQLPTLATILSTHPELISHPGTSLRIDNEPWMYLAIENIGAGPRGLPALSVAHYGEQNGDPMRDPEMCFEMVIERGAVTGFQPYYFRQDYLAFEQTSVWIQANETTGTNDRKIDDPMLNGQCEFALIWDENLREQGFPEAVATATLTPA